MHGAAATAGVSAFVRDVPAFVSAVPCPSC